MASADKNKRKVFLVDDHPLVREWLGNLINHQPDLRVCGEANNKAEAMKLVPESQPDIIIVDISMDGGSGLELIKDIHTTHPQIITLVLSMHDEARYAERALRAGARGYVTKREATKKVLEAIRCVLGGKLYLSQMFATLMAQKFVEGVPPVTMSPVDQLSDRELEVFEMLGRGVSTRQIAENLNLSFKTVQSFCARIKQKLNLSNATELLSEAIRWHDRRPME